MAIMNSIMTKSKKLADDNTPCDPDYYYTSAKDPDSETELDFDDLTTPMGTIETSSHNTKDGPVSSSLNDSASQPSTDNSFDYRRSLRVESTNERLDEVTTV